MFKSVFVLATLGAMTPIANATELDDVGFASLQATYGAGLADGSSVTPTLVEATTGPQDLWRPNPDHAELDDVSFVDRTPVPAPIAGVYSAHATGSARRLVGDTLAMARGASTVEVYQADDWLINFLNFADTAGPSASSSRVASHSWVGSFDDTTADVLALLATDWTIARDDFVQVVGNANGTNLRPLLSNSYNAIAVGVTEDDHSTGTLALGSVYVAGRANPQIVAPATTTSAATPIVASAAIILIDAAHDNPNLSAEPGLLPRSGAAIKSAASAEVVKALLMAGADRITSNPVSANITDYRAIVANQTSNGLDRRFGAGQLDIFTSYEMLLAGEQQSLEDGGGSILGQGFDYDPAFGGALASNTTGTYAFTTGSNDARLAASLVWHLFVDDDDGNYAPAPVLVDLNLELWKIDNTLETLVAASSSAVDNTENLWQVLNADTDYELRVVNAEAFDFAWDYGLAWNIQAIPLPASLPFLLRALMSLGVYEHRSRRAN